MDLGNTIQTMTAPPVPRHPAPQHQGGRWSREKRVQWGAGDKDTPTSCVELSGLDCLRSRAPPGGQGPMCPFSPEHAPSPASALGFIKVALDWGLGHHGGRGLRGLWSTSVAFA